MWRRVWVGLLAIVLLFGAGYSVWWYVLARRVESGFADWAAARQAAGWTVTVGGSRLGGWPMAARLVLSDVKLRGGAPELPATIAWDAAELDLQVAPFDPGTLVILPHGQQRIGIADGPTLALTGRLLRGQLPLDRLGPPWPLDVEGEAVRVRSTNAGASSRGEALIAHLTAHAALDPSASSKAAALALTVEAGRIDLPSGGSWPLGERIEAVTGTADISGPMPPAGQPTARAQAWRQAGGAVVLQRGTLRWGPLDGSAAGRISLDAALQPTVEGTARITGWAPALDVLAAHHVIPDHAALAAKAVVSLLAETPAGGGPSVLTVPFAAKDGVLILGGIPVVRLPTLSWPAS
jgi:hypothetical protein